MMHLFSQDASHVAPSQVKPEQVGPSQVDEPAQVGDPMQVVDPIQVELPGQVDEPAKKINRRLWVFSWFPPKISVNHLDIVRDPYPASLFFF